MTKLDSKQLQDLTDELAALSRQQYDARRNEVFVGMTPQETKTYDHRAERISRIHIILSEHGGRR